MLCGNCEQRCRNDEALSMNDRKLRPSVPAECLVIRIYSLVTPSSFVLTHSSFPQGTSVFPDLEELHLKNQRLIRANVDACTA